jgi:hypothetical protein
MCIWSVVVRIIREVATNHQSPITSWTLFVSVILSFPTVKPVTPQTMNYASVITAGVIFLAM